MTSNYIVLLPVFQPDETLVDFVKEISEYNFYKIILVDDGNAECKEARKYETIIEKAGAYALVIKSQKNEGKGRALKKGFKYVCQNFPECKGVITADCDGKYLAKDIFNTACALSENPDKVIVGVRPLKGRVADKIACAFFKFSTGKKCSDVRSGLKGIPSGLFSLACREDGCRFEYETNFLSDAVTRAPLLEVAVTAPVKNPVRHAHFKPFHDTLLLYWRFVKFLMSSFSSFLVDYILFLFLNYFLRLKGMKSVTVIFAATAFSRFVSSIMAYLINRVWSFKGRIKRKNIFAQFGKFFLLWIFVIAVNSLLVYLLELIFIPVAIAKLMSNTVTFFINYKGQNKWVFAERKKKKNKSLENAA